MTDCNRPKKIWGYPVTYGTPAPRYIRPLVRINGMTEDMPSGYTFPKCLLPPTELQLDPCTQTLRVNDAMISYVDMIPCLKMPQGSGVPTNPPAEGYLPLYVDLAATPPATYIWAGEAWNKIG